MAQDAKHLNAQDWMPHMERKRNKLEDAGYEMDDETFLTHAMVSLNPEEYQATILTGFYQKFKNPSGLVLM